MAETLAASPGIAECTVACASEAAPAAAERNSYGQILRSSALIGGASLVTMATGIIRAKAMALLLGPAGVGLMGAYAAIADVARSLAELGINNSGVRQIAEAAASGDGERVARTASVLRRTAIVLGVLGGAALLVFAGPISRLTFGDATHAGAVALLSLAVLLRLIADGQTAMVQGLRRIGDLARINIFGALLGTALGVALIVLLREQGVAAALITMAGASALCAWWFSRSSGVRRAPVAFPEMRREAAALLHLGFAFLASGVLMTGSAYAVRLLVLRDLGLESAGHYQAAWTLGGLYVGFVLQAMGADFYPRLVGAVNRHAECNRLVNEQTRISLLMAGPGVIATLGFAPWVLTLFYSAGFEPATATLRWLCLGMALRVLTWPMGFIIVAKSDQRTFLLTEIAWAIANVGLTALLLPIFGLAGTGIAFFGSYVVHGLVVYAVVSRLSGFRWSADNLRASLGMFGLCLLVVVGYQVLPAPWGHGIAALALLQSGWAALRALASLMPEERLPNWLRWMRRTRADASVGTSAGRS